MKTKTKEGKLNPEWNETFELEALEGDEVEVQNYPDLDYWLENNFTKNFRFELILDIFTLVLTL